MMMHSLCASRHAELVPASTSRTSSEGVLSIRGHGVALIKDDQLELVAAGQGKTAPHTANVEPANCAMLCSATRIGTPTKEHAQ